MISRGTGEREILPGRASLYSESKEVITLLHEEKGIILALLLRFSPSEALFQFTRDDKILFVYLPSLPLKEREDRPEAPWFGGESEAGCK